LFEGKKDVKHARNKGLAEAKGRYILNADADTIYPPQWIDMMTAPLADSNVACTYGKFSFFPDSGTSRLLYFLYECIGDQYKLFIQKSKEEAIYVYGFSSCYRREQGIAVDGYNHPPGSNEDGYLGLKLKQRFGKLVKVRENEALAWTSDRRLQSEGGIFSAFKNRVNKAANT
jgi:glycosyltransferase involved in cell wall biosynthesis